MFNPQKQNYRVATTLSSAVASWGCCDFQEEECHYPSAGGSMVYFEWGVSGPQVCGLWSAYIGFLWLAGRIKLSMLNLLWHLWFWSFETFKLNIYLNKIFRKCWIFKIKSITTDLTASGQAGEDLLENQQKPGMLKRVTFCKAACSFNGSFKVSLLDDNVASIGTIWPHNATCPNESQVNHAAQ